MRLPRLCHLGRVLDSPKVRVGAAVLLLAAVVGAQWYAWWRIAQVERKDRDTARATAFRLCSRMNVDRAFAHYRVYMVGGPPELMKLQEPEQLPLLDCKPNLQGMPAAAMSSAEQRVFMDRWSRGELSPVERGLCPDGPPIGARLSPTSC